MKLFTHCSHIEMEKDMESAHIEIERDMEERVTYRMLLEAAILGTKMEELRRLLQDDPAILDRVMWECRGKDNPLHVGALNGNVDFVREILNRKRELTRELNSEGQSPLHLALASGHVEVVKEILSKDTDACFIRDRDGMVPLHLAAINERIKVLEELVKAEKITAFILTKSGEPILHLCANNNKFEALKKLIELVKDDPGFVNLRDRGDNTILHLLSAKENDEVIEFLVKTTKAELNAENMVGFTPLDISLQNRNIVSGYRIQLLLIVKGAKRGRNKSRYWGPREIEGSIKESRFDEALLVVVILVATVAFQARLSPPGGVWQDTALPNATLPNATQPSPPNPVPHNATQSSPSNLVPHSAGQSIMSNVDAGAYWSFSISNDFTLLLSLVVIQLLLANPIFKSSRVKMVAMALTFFSLVAMSFTYYYSATFISSDKKTSYTCIVVLLSIYTLTLSIVAIFFLSYFGLRFFYILSVKLKAICNTA